MGSDKPHPVSHVAYGYGACVATIDEKNFVSKMDVAFDVGRVINPKACEGQVEGGTLMGMGYGVTEDFKMDNGRVVTKYGTLGYSERNSGRTLPYILLKRVRRTKWRSERKGLAKLPAFRWLRLYPMHTVILIKKNVGDFLCNIQAINDRQGVEGV